MEFLLIIGALFLIGVVIAVGFSVIAWLAAIAGVALVVSLVTGIPFDSAFPVVLVIGAIAFVVSWIRS